MDADPAHARRPLRRPPRVRVRAALRGRARRRRRRAAHPLPRRGAGATATVVLCLHGEPSWSLPLPPHDPGARRRRAPRRRARPRRLRSLATSPRARDRLHLRSATSSGCARRCSTSSTSRGITLVCQDWGGLLGLRLVGEHPDRFARVVAANTFLPTGDRDPGEAFLRLADVLPGGRDLPDRGHRQRRLHHRPRARGRSPAYDAPFPDESYKEGARQFPTARARRRPTTPASAANRAAWEVLERFDRPFLCAFGDSDPITAGADRVPARRDPRRGRASPTPRSSAAATSSRRTAAPSWPGSSSTSSPRPADPTRLDQCPETRWQGVDRPVG